MPAAEQSRECRKDPFRPDQISERRIARVMARGYAEYHAVLFAEPN